MLSEMDAMRLAAEEATQWGIGFVITSIWGDEEKYIIWIEPDLYPLGPLDGSVPIIVHRSNGRIEYPGSAVPPDTYMQGMTKLPWSPYRPVDPNISSTRIRKCRNCGGKLVSIAWGMPDSELIAQAERGEVTIGGCVIPGPGEPHPLKQCRDCEWQLLIEPNDPLH